MKKFLKSLAMAAALSLPALAHSTVVYSTWTSNDSTTGNYIVSATLNGSVFDVTLTVNPWNAEALGIFIDLGNATITNATLSNAAPVGQVSVVATDTTSSSCGSGCNLNGLTIPGGGDWEWVLRLGNAGFDGIQTFSFSLAANGLTESAWSTIGIRAQQLCPSGTLLPSGNCDGSDKSYSSTPGGSRTEVPEPGTLALVSLALLGVGAARRRRAA